MHTASLMATPHIEWARRRRDAALAPTETKGPIVISLQIPTVNGLLVVISCLIGFGVYRRCRDSHAGPPTAEDRALGFTALATALLVFGFLFGVGDEKLPESTPRQPEASVTSTAPPSAAAPSSGRR